MCQSKLTRSRVSHNVALLPVPSSSVVEVASVVLNAEENERVGLSVLIPDTGT